jgi:hypothetical protein
MSIPCITRWNKNQKIPERKEGRRATGQPRKPKWIHHANVLDRYWQETPHFQDTAERSKIRVPGLFLDPMIHSTDMVSTAAGDP